MPRKSLLTVTQKRWIFGFPRALNKWKPAEKLLCFFLKINIAHKFFKQCIPLPASYKKCEWRTVSRHGLILKLDLSEQVDWYNYFYLEQKGFEHFLSMLQPKEVIFDIGANIGTTALRLAKKSSEGFVYAFEPDPYNYKRLLENIAFNNIPNIKTYNYACSNKNGIGKLEDCNPHNGGMKSIVTGNDPALIEIKLITVDQFMEEEKIEYLTALKMDTEGHEVFVLEGGRVTLKQNKIKIFSEVNESALLKQNCNPEQLIKNFNSLQFTNIINAETHHGVSSGDNFENCNFDVICY